MGTGLGITICVQSSSITTSALTPLAADGSKLAITLQVAYCHLFFNLSGILVFYVIWPLRWLPINAAKFLGNTTAEYKWFAIAYLFMCFFIIPALFFALSIASTPACIVIAILFFLTGLFVVVVNTLQA